MTSKFRIVAFVEAVTFLLLLSASVWHRGFDGPDLVAVMGPVHGLAFLAYLGLALAIRESQKWGFWSTVLVIVAAAVPLGGFFVADRLVDDGAVAATAPR